MEGTREEEVQLGDCGNSDNERVKAWDVIIVMEMAWLQERLISANHQKLSALSNYSVMAQK